ncbi:MAG: hypothetical protein ACK5WZ_04440 [Pseudobdellovibrionaceae bacterium]
MMNNSSDQSLKYYPSLNLKLGLISVVCLMLGSLVVFPMKAHAKLFKNAYISFELPNAWQCKLEQTEWVCRSDDSKESKEAIIILTAKEVGPSDSIQLYEQHLNNPIKLRVASPFGNESKVTYKAQNKKINEQDWLDGLHLGSEVPNYYTRYLATIKDQIAVLVTFSAHKDFYPKYSQEFLKAVQSLRVTATRSMLNQGGSSAGIGPASGDLFVGPGEQMTGLLEPGDLEKPRSKGKMLQYFAIALILIAGGIFIYLRKKKN